MRRPWRGVVGSAGNIGGQAFVAGLVDEIRVDLVPMVFGAGFGSSVTSAHPQNMDDPEIMQGNRVTHLIFRVRGREPSQ